MGALPVEGPILKSFRSARHRTKSTPRAGPGIRRPLHPLSCAPAAISGCVSWLASGVHVERLEGLAVASLYLSAGRVNPKEQALRVKLHQRCPGTRPPKRRGFQDRRASSSQRSARRIAVREVPRTATGTCRGSTQPAQRCQNAAIWRVTWLPRLASRPREVLPVQVVWQNGRCLARTGDLLLVRQALYQLS